MVLQNLPPLKTLPQPGDVRDRITFAWLPQVVTCKDGTRCRVWLEPYFKREQLTYGLWGDHWCCLSRNKAQIIYPVNPLD